MTHRSSDIETGRTTSPRRIEIDFLYIDLEVCHRCIGTDANLDVALKEAAEVLRSGGVEVSLRKILVESEEQARELRFVGSPTIRINGRDIAPAFRESRCEDCCRVSDGDVDCRVWVYQGREYTEAPKEMIVEAVLREVYGGPLETSAPAAPFEDVPENLKHFFSRKGRRRKEACCPPKEQESCCEPSEKESCCDTTESSDCGCR